MQQPQRITATTVRVAQRAKLGRNLAPAVETWAQRQARVTAERAARQAARQAKACPGWGEDCGTPVTGTSDLCPDCIAGRLDAQSPRVCR
ncbi:hypothetical protein [Streptomyces collinus]